MMVLLTRTCIILGFSMLQVAQMEWRMWQCVTLGHTHVIPRDLFEPYLKIELIHK